MPRYDFQCLDCQAEFELDLKIAEKEGNSNKKICKKCQSSHIEQIITFKGAISTSSSSSSAAPSCPTGSCPFMKN